MSNLTKKHLILQEKYNVSFGFKPGSNYSGSFLLLWSPKLKPAAKRITSSTDFQLLNFVKLDWFVINIYAYPNSFQAISNSLKISIRFLPRHSKTIMRRDSNALNYEKLNSSSVLKLLSSRIKRFT